MAESLDDGEFWLPPQFLTDDDLFCDKKTGGGSKDEFVSEATTVFPKDLFPLEFPYGFDSYSVVSSDVSSPVDSVVGSAEESDEENTKGMAVTGSPQLTLCGVGGCSCRKTSSQGSPNECSKDTSPPATWDLLHAAAGEVARIRMDEEGCVLNRHSRGILGVPQNSTPDLVFSRQQSIANHKILAAQFHQMRQQQIIKQSTPEVWGCQAKNGAAVYQNQNQGQPAVQPRVRNIGRHMGGLSPSVWPPLQQAQHRESGSGMRALFLGNRGAKRECAGTGVFLPRQIATSPVVSRKKSACSTVLVPEKVVQALKLNDGGQKPQPQQSMIGIFHPGGENGPMPRYCNVQKRNHKPQQEIELRLPQEWTY